MDEIKGFIKMILQVLVRLDLIIMYLFYCIRSAIKPGKVLMLSDSRETLSGNLFFIDQELRNRGYQPEYFLKKNLEVKRTFREKKDLCKAMAEAEFILVDDFYPLIYPIPLRRKTQLIQVWHAMGAFKTVGFSRMGKPGGPSRFTMTHRNYTDAIVSSEEIRKNYAEAFRMKIDQVHATGIPRTDIFFDPEYEKMVKERIYSRFPRLKNKKVILFAPTFRGNGQLTAHYDYSRIDFSRIKEALSGEYQCIIKMHPFIHNLEGIPEDDFYLNLTEEREINDLLFITDVLITDYSSVIFEASLRRIKTVFFVPDLEEYIASRDFYYPFEDYTCGEVTRNTEELIAAIRNPYSDGEKMDRFVEKFCSACDGKSTRRFVDQLIEGKKDDPEQKVQEGRNRIEKEEAPAEKKSGQKKTRKKKLQGRKKKKITIKRAAFKGMTAMLNFLYFFLKLLPVQKKVVYLSRQQNTTPLDFELIIQEMKKNYPDYRNVTLVKMVPDSLSGKIGYCFFILKQMYHLATAETAILDTYSIPVCLLKQRPSLKVIQIWHALGAFKKFSFSILDQEEGRSSEMAELMHMHENYTWVLTSSKYCSPYFREAFRVREDQMKVIPLPRVDYICSPATKTAVRRKIYDRYPGLKDSEKKILVYAPTFRKYEVDFQQAVRNLTGRLDMEKYLLIVKLHPLSKVTIKAPGVIVDREFATHEIFQIADAVITDYSAVIFEAVLLDLPVYFYAFDYEQYMDKRNFYLDYMTEMPGPISRTAEELVRDLEEEKCSPERIRAFRRRMIADIGCTGAEAIAELAVRGRK